MTEQNGLMPENPDAEERAHHHRAMGSSVDLINAIIDGTQYENEEVSTRVDIMDRNVRHLEIMVAKTYWDGEDMAPSNAAITAGKAYIADNS